MVPPCSCEPAAMTNCWANSGFTACFEPADGDLSAAAGRARRSRHRRAACRSAIADRRGGARLEALGFTGDNLLAEPHRPLTPETMRLLSGLLAELYANIAKHTDPGELVRHLRHLRHGRHSYLRQRHHHTRRHGTRPGQRPRPLPDHHRNTRRHLPNPRRTSPLAAGCQHSCQELARLGTR